MDLPGRTTGEADGYARLARKGIAAYGLADAQLSLISHRRRIVFSVIDDDPDGREVYALRICDRDQSRGGLMREFLFLEELRRGSDLNVPEPVLTRKGELIQSLSTPGISGFRLVCLLRWVAGRPVPIDDWTEKHASAVGRMIGEIHRCSEGFDWPSELKPPESDAERIPPLPDRVPPSKREALERATKLARRALASLTSDRNERGIIHADLVSEHILFSKAGVGAIGFSSCRAGYYLYDLASIALELEEPLREALIAGYGEIRAVKREALLGMLALRALDLMCKAREDRLKLPLELMGEL